MSQPIDPGPQPEWTVTTPAWPQPASAAPQPAPVAAPGNRSRWVLGGAALAGLAAGAVGATFLVTAVFAASAEDIGRSMGEEMASGITEGLSAATEDQMNLLLEGMFGEESMGWYGGAAGGEVEQFPPVEPVDLGPDAVLDEYAEACFEGDYQACDDLMYESAPLSAYEEYASTCGGRVKEFTVPACTELE